MCETIVSGIFLLGGFEGKHLLVHDEDYIVMAGFALTIERRQDFFIFLLFALVVQKLPSEKPIRGAGNVPIN